MLGETIGETSGKITSQRILPNLGGGPKMETSFQANGSILSTTVKETGHLLDHRPSGRNTLRRGARGDDDQGWENSHLDRPWCRYDEEGRDRKLSRCCLLSNFSPTMGPTEQGCSGIRIRGRRRGQHTLRILGMEVARTEACEILIA